jgi:hypothetical protein
LASASLSMMMTTIMVGAITLSARRRAISLHYGRSFPTARSYPKPCCQYSAASADPPAWSAEERRRLARRLVPIPFQKKPRQGPARSGTLELIPKLKLVLPR